MKQGETWWVSVSSKRLLIGGVRGCKLEIVLFVWKRGGVFVSVL